MSNAESKLFERNIDGLNEMGVVGIARTGINVEAEPAIDSELQISGLDARTSLKIVRALELLMEDATTDEQRSRHLEHLNRVEYLNGPSVEDSIAFHKSISNGKYTLTLGETKEGDYVIEAGISNDIKGDDRHRARRNLNGAYIDALSKLVLFHEEIDETTDESVARMEVPVERRLGRLASLLRKETRELIEDERSRQQKESSFYFNLLGLVSNGEDEQTLRDFWEKINQDPIAMIDLQLYVWSDKQGSAIQNNFPVNDIHDLSDTLSTTPSLLNLRHELQNQSILEYEKMGFLRNDVERVYQVATSEQAKLQLRYASWLLSQPFMSVARREIRNTYREGLPMNNREVFNFTYHYLIEAYKQFRDIDRHDFDTSLGYHKRKVWEMNRFFKANTLMAMHIFYNHDVTPYLKSRE